MKQSRTVLLALGVAVIFLVGSYGYSNTQNNPEPDYMTTTEINELISSRMSGLAFSLPGDLDLDSVDALTYRLDGVDLTDRLQEQNATGATAYVGFDQNLDYLPNYWVVDGVADEVQISQAVNYGGIVNLEIGNYSFSSSLVLDRIGTILLGSGKNTVLSATGSFYTIQVVADYNTLENFKILDTSSSLHTIFVAGDYFTAENIIVEDADGTAIFCENTADYVRIYDCRFFNNTSHDINLKSPTIGHEIVGFYSEGCGDTPINIYGAEHVNVGQVTIHDFGNDAIAVDGCKYITISLFSIWNGGESGIVISSETDGGYGDNAYIEIGPGTIYKCGEAAIDMNPEPGYMIEYIDIHNVQINDTWPGIQYNPGILLKANYSRVVDNTITLSGDDGILVRGASHGNIIERNIISNPGRSSGDGISVEDGSYNNTIRNNEVFGCDYGIVILTGCNDNVVVYNDLRGNINSGISDSGTNTDLGKRLHYIYLPPGFAETGTSWSTRDQYATPINFSSYDNYVNAVYFYASGLQENVGTFTIYIQLYDITGSSAISGSEISASLVQYSKTRQKTSDIKNGLTLTGERWYCIQIKAEDGGKSSWCSAGIIVETIENII